MQKMKILAIDDEQIVLDSLQKILISQSYSVDTTLKGGEGIYWAITRPYGLVLSDIRMPDISGMHVLRDIKRKKPTLPVVIITGYATVRSAVQAMKLGATDYIEKPFTPDQLLETVASALADTQPPEEQKVIHPDVVLQVLDRAAVDDEFGRTLLDRGSEALEEYTLTGPEKLALITGDVNWLEQQMGPLEPVQKQWLEHRLGAEIWELRGDLSCARGC